MTRKNPKIREKSRNILLNKREKEIEKTIDRKREGRRDAQEP